MHPHAALSAQLPEVVVEKMEMSFATRRNCRVETLFLKLFYTSNGLHIPFTTAVVTRVQIPEPKADRFDERTILCSCCVVITAPPRELSPRPVATFVPFR